MRLVLIISVCKEKLHELEFVKPVEEILRGARVKFFTKNYKLVSSTDLKRVERVVICGTSLKDNQFLEDMKIFEWIKSFDKPLLGICAGMQILGQVFGEKIARKEEIGFFMEQFNQDFFGLFGEQEVYHLHGNFVKFGEGWQVFCEGNGITQAVKKRGKPFY